jgi:lysine 2,3-aminomutase
MQPHWKELIAASITTADQFARRLQVSPDEIQSVMARYPARINPYYFSLIREPQDPIWRQVVPDTAEILGNQGSDDPLCETARSPVPNLIHRYPDRVVLLVSASCAVFCRYCMRKRLAGQPAGVTAETIQAGIEYILKTPDIRDVILSGGDPLLLEDEILAGILTRIRSAPHVEIIRIHTRVPCVLPQRITPNLARMLSGFHPLYVNTHFNHPREITPESASACALLTDAGIPLGCQTVLLKGVNDDPVVMRDLMRKLLMIRVKPYYLHQADWVRGTTHFHTDLQTGLNIMARLRGYLSGMGVPQYMVDLPAGRGKIPLLPEYVKEKRPGVWIIQTYDGQTVEYPLPGMS